MEKISSEQAIIDAALKVFSTKGYAETRMADIAKEAKLSYGLIYHYFENKEKLFDAIVGNWWNAIYEEIERLKASPVSTKEKLVGIVRFMLNAYNEMPELMSIFIAEVSRGYIYHSDPQRRENILKYLRVCEDIIREGQARGALRTDLRPKYLTYIFIGSVDTFLSVMVLGNEKLTKARENRIIDSVTSVFLHGAEAEEAH
jgi:TetR/AcrR family fatty acid metabolism transcriptional regulator